MSSSKKKSATQTPAAAIGTRIYCGPSLPRGELNQYATFRGGIPGHVESLTKKCPAISRLIVPVSALEETRRAVAQAGSAENVWYNEVMNYIKGGATH
jgi:hypothetical protein